MSRRAIGNIFDLKKKIKMLGRMLNLILFLALFRSCNACSSGPLVSMTTYPTDFQGSSAGNIQYKINYTTTAMCQGIITCALTSISTADMDFQLGTASDIIITIMATTPAGSYSIDLTCQEQSTILIGTSITIPYTVYYSQAISMVTTGLTFSIPDSLPTLWNYTQLYATSAGMP
jgi:predicted neutral ceramidase superfamily lipid hydrolase